MRAIQDGIPWVQKFFQNCRRASSVSAAAQMDVPVLYDSHLRKLNSDIVRDLRKCGSSGGSLMTEDRLQVARDWYADLCEDLIGLQPEPADMPDNWFQPHGLGMKLVGELLRHVEAMANEPVQPASCRGANDEQ